MSYILDALRRSQAERERGRVPGLEARSAAAAPAPAERPPVAWLGWGLAALLLLAWGGWALRPAPEVPIAPVAPVAAPAAATPVAAAPAPRPALPIVVSAPPVQVPTPLQPGAQSTAPASALAPTPSPTPSPAPKATPSPAPAPLQPLPQPHPQAAAPLPWSQLTPEQQRAWPALAMGGVIWSENAASRYLIVNGQVVREGEFAAPGVVLERIGPKSAVLRRQGERVEMPF
ncbi:MAG: general secretion pathway protein GspB [Burkholderiales bacterium]|nr:general secretion pathway protein GspB [Burkholderiales bacterium]